MAPTIYFAGNLLDIVINVDRLCNFMSSFVWIRKQNAFAIWFLLLAACFAINVPTLLRYYAETDHEFYSQLFNSYESRTGFHQCGAGLFRNNLIALSKLI